MKFILFCVFTLFSVALVGGHAVTPQVYWKAVLPNSPMPKSIKDLLYSTGVRKGGVDITSHRHWNYADAAENQLKDITNVPLFFLDKDLHQGKEMNLHFRENNQKATFLPRKIADSIPFSSNNLPEIYNEFSMKPNSMEAKIMKQTLNECENKGIQGVERYCATSLESMVDFSTSKLGKKVKAISTEVNAKDGTLLQMYKIKVVKKLAANKVMVCHKQNYAYAVFSCHKIASTRAYVVSMAGANGAKVNAVAICHADTTKWNPKNLAFQMVKVKPGSVPICHFITPDEVVWVPY